VLLSALQLTVLLLLAAALGYACARLRHVGTVDARCARLQGDVDHLRRRLAASRSELSAREREIRAGNEEIERLDAQLTSAEIERAELRARLGRAARRTNGRPAPAAPRGVPPNAGPLDDDLERIHGIGPTIARRLRRLGVRRFHDIMQWTDADLERVAADIRAPAGRIRRDRWTEQARELASRQPRLAATA
jgi:predicted flap endonuclease-1-like 5' DNA nuclease